jgi:hypothetical protein
VSSPDKAIDSKDRAIPGSHSALYDRRASARSIRSIAFAAKARQKTASATITPPPEVAAVGETTTPERCDSLETAAAVIAEAQAGLSLRQGSTVESINTINIKTDSISGSYMNAF